MTASLELTQFAHEHMGEEDPILQELYRETHLKVLHPRMLSGFWQGKLLQMITAMIRPRNILEIGTYTAYSALYMAKALPEGAKIHTIEVNDELESFIRKWIERAGASDQIELHIGNALEIIPQLEGPFDMVFMDGEKSEYVEYYELLMQILPSGSFILADNIFWDGKVFEPAVKSNDYSTKGILKFNQMVKDDDRVEKVILPLRDGIFLIRKK